MESVTHREMRNRSAELLRRVEAGESIIVTNNGRPVAVISPLERRVLEELVDQGHVRRATRAVADLRDIERTASALRTDQILDDTRGHW
ncbi:type II toxin-antitoxin system prevent-host-death family antitoxin [Gordonia sp. HNM0687]|uniref:Antitoxin n=1 Tax=Gordonia mangrovi TaxID=2665643 RepID=A0A6L7GZQ4_9ACTN|nr:type II toxin-antitoxin system prevent-host-death family antitoxin [Gordonia mangrovi]MXP24425.1 type II toxin-antitoxin system prevent-host-death family antitoxin [Gordonia mangrovi]UVF79960.1 type II toxin-antitoxin system prevent-host-death family antitoxin [Gordonia mangrovi]